MPKRVEPHHLEPILEIVGRFRSGASIRQIEAAIDVEMPRRTLQRWLASLEKTGELVRLGKGRATRYCLPNSREITVTDGIQTSISPVSGELYSPFSSEGLEIRAIVSEPLSRRVPVGYAREFLDTYRPNQSFYLPDDLRQEMMDLGQLPEQQIAGTYARQLLDRLLIDLSWNSSRLEGNTYSLLETAQLIEQGEVAEGKDAREAQMILNHKEAIEFLVSNGEEIGFNRHTVLNLHALLSVNLLGDPQAGGRLRTSRVDISGTVFHPLEMPQAIEECFEQILATASAIDDPFEQGFFIMVHLPYLQPFIDVNKGVTRLAANIPLIQNNLCPLSFVEVGTNAYVQGLLGIYEMNRIELMRDMFVWAYRRSVARYSAIQQSLGEPDAFRVRYRQQFYEVVHEIVAKRYSQAAATPEIRRFADANIKPEDRDRFLEVVENELLSLHEGNMARYRIRPSEFISWQELWS